MARTRDRVTLLLLAIGLVSAWVAIEYEIVWMIALLFAGGGAALLASGVWMIHTREARIPSGGSESSSFEHHRGITAQLWGVVSLLFSLVLFVVAYNLWPFRNGAPDVFELLSRVPSARGIVTTIAGAGFVTFGLTRLLAPKKAFAETGMSTLERYFTGVCAFAVGALMVLIGLLWAFAPSLLSFLGNRLGEILKALL